MLVQCLASVEDGGPTLNQHCIDISCLLGPGVTVRGLVKVKKNQKSEKKLGLVRQHPPTPLTFFFFFETF